MDGVVADWNPGVNRILGYTATPQNINGEDKYSAEDWRQIAAHGRMYLELPLTAQAHQVVAVARDFRDFLGYRLLFLTAIPHGNDMPWAFYDKVMWAQGHFPDIPVHFGPYSRNKQHHCRPGDILVDDRADNCARWQQAEGRAILVNPPAELTGAIDQLREILTQEREALAR
jgi:hypothetical protein